MAKAPKKDESEESEALEKKKKKAARDPEEEPEEDEEDDDEDEDSSDLEDEDEDEDEEEDDEEEDELPVDEFAADEAEEELVLPKKKPKKVAAPKETKSKKKPGKVVPVKLVWGVFSNSNQRVATYRFNEKKDAEEHAKRLMTEKKSTFFVQPVKEPMSADELDKKGHKK